MRTSPLPLMYAAGLSLAQIGDLVGHSSAHMTERYRHLLDDGRLVAEAVKKQDVYLNSFRTLRCSDQPNREYPTGRRFLPYDLNHPEWHSVCAGTARMRLPHA